MDSSLFDRFYQIGIIPVLEIDSALHAKPVTESLFAGGLPLAEITRMAKAVSTAVKQIRGWGNIISVFV